jgi:hypothetical protein
MNIFITFIVILISLIAVIVIPGYRGGDELELVLGLLEVLGFGGLLFGFGIILLALFEENSVVSAYWSGIIKIGLSQFLSVIPRSLILFRQRRWARFKGVIAGAVIVSYLNGGCWLLLGGRF